MNPELKAKWVKALRSGEYEQGKGLFEDDGKFCCLGVLCVVANKPTTGGEFGVGNWLFAHNELPGGRDTSHRLADMNDRGTPFAEIADYIEANL